jgi:HEAT repeat protein
MMPMERRARIAVLAIICFAGGCAGTRPYRANLSSDNATERVMAVKAAGEAKDVGSVPLLVDRLEDEDSAVRFFSIIALEKITGRRFGYDYSQPSRERAAAIVRWRDFVRKGEYTAATEPPAPRSSSDFGDQTGIAAGP